MDLCKEASLEAKNEEHDRFYPYKIGKPLRGQPMGFEHSGGRTDARTHARVKTLGEERSHGQASIDPVSAPGKTRQRASAQATQPEACCQGA
ncbi:unnamed protein product [Mesocestoides corti]|uniref:DNA primase n=1 Tax=Mesocestoides corti TaxID=53468 RepID=A0A0R3UNY7_MESCO|nr:unnamed protein product [Mesocestoides corti]